MKKTVLALACVLFAASASAQEIMIDFGLTKFTPVANGNWYQDGFPHTLRLISPSGSIKLYTDPSENGWQYGIGVGNAGRATSDAMVLDSDANYNANSPTHCNGPCGPLSHMQGQGTVPFVFFAVRKTWDVDWGIVKGPVFAEFGPYITRPNYENTNFDWYGGPNNSIGPIVSHIDHQPKNTLGWGAAVGYKFSDHCSAILKIIPTSASNSQSDPGTTDGTAYYRAIYAKVSGFAGIEYKF